MERRPAEILPLLSIGVTYQSMSRLEQIILKNTLIDGQVTNRALRTQTGMHHHDITTSLRSLTLRKFLVRHGKTTGAYYTPGSELLSLKKPKSVEHEKVKYQESYLKEKVSRASDDKRIAIDESPIALVSDSGYADLEHLMSAILEACSTPKSLEELCILLNRSKQRLRIVIRMLIKSEKLRREHPLVNHPRQRYVRI